ncbi:MAG: hypothetical protein JW795_04950 [Chitinivibrionales bacterium]|nr:hypothetical protein [Chitinivibrionales bacterium]
MKGFEFALFLLFHIIIYIGTFSFTQAQILQQQEQTYSPLPIDSQQSTLPPHLEFKSDTVLAAITDSALTISKTDTSIAGCDSTTPLITIIDTLCHYCKRVALTEQDLADGYASLNREFSEKTSLKCGRVLYLRFLQNNTRHHQAMAGLAQLYGWSQMFGRAIMVYDRLLESYPEDDDARLGKAIIHSWNKDYVASNTILDSLIRRDSNNVDALVHQSRLLSWQGNLDSSISICLAIVKNHPENIEAYRIIADSYKWGKHYNMARPYYKHIVQQSTDSATIYEALFMLAQLDWLCGKSGSAVKQFSHLHQVPALKKRSEQALADIKATIAPTLKTEAHYGGESAYNDSLKKFQFGLVQSDIAVSIEKPFSMNTLFTAGYGLVWQRAENFLAIRQPLLYEFTSHNLLVSATYTTESNLKATLVYNPYLYQLIQDSIQKTNGKKITYTEYDLSHDFGLSGSNQLRNLRLFWGLHAKGFLIDTVKSDICSSYEGQFSLLLPLSTRFSLNPSALVTSIADGNMKHSYELTLADQRSFFKARSALTLSYKLYHKRAKGYFSYYRWMIAQFGMQWPDGISIANPAGRFFLPLAWDCDADVLLPVYTRLKMHSIQENLFGAASISLTPTVRISPKSYVAFNTFFYVNTNSYVVYTIGLRHELRF